MKNEKKKTTAGPKRALLNFDNTIAEKIEKKTKKKVVAARHIEIYSLLLTLYSA
ncbi:MAG: hypothetical protein V1740_02485 [Candidatus Woesearchaeota archaeon]